MMVSRDTLRPATSWSKAASVGPPFRVHRRLAQALAPIDEETQPAAGWHRPVNDISARKKGRRRSAAQVLGGTRREAKRLLSSSRPQTDSRLFPAVFVQTGKWLRNCFFGTRP